MIIAIDGPAAAGKGTVATALADFFNFAFLDTGRLYRATALSLLESGADPNSETDAESAALSLKGKNIYELTENPHIRDEKTGLIASKVAAYPKVRAALLDVQRNFAHHPYFSDNTPAKGAVLDGRDIGSTVCPDAEIKIFVTASDKIRAMRRFKELQLKDKSVIYDAVLADLIARDKRDRERTVSPLTPAKDAYILDTTDLSVPDTAAKAIEYANAFIKRT